MSLNESSLVSGDVGKRKGIQNEVEGEEGYSAFLIV